MIHVMNELVRWSIVMHPSSTCIVQRQSSACLSLTDVEDLSGVGLSMFFKCVH